MQFASWRVSLLAQPHTPEDYVVDHFPVALRWQKPFSNGTKDAWRRGIVGQRPDPGWFPVEVSLGAGLRSP